MSYRKLLRRIMFILLFGIVSSIIAFFISLLLHHYLMMRTFDIMAIIGLLIVIIGAVSSIGGNPSGVNLSNMGQVYSQYSSHLNLEVTKMERESTDYFRNTVNHVKLHFFGSSLNVILNGVFIILTSVGLSYFS